MRNIGGGDWVLSALRAMTWNACGRKINRSHTLLAGRFPLCCSPPPWCFPLRLCGGWAPLRFFVPGSSSFHGITRCAHLGLQCASPEPAERGGAPRHHPIRPRAWPTSRPPSHTHTDREQHPPHRHTHAHDKVKIRSLFSLPQELTHIHCRTST